MLILRGGACAAGIAALLLAAPATADYESHPELRPENRCVTTTESGDTIPFSDAGIDPLHCQKLFWDIPIPLELGYRAAAAPYEADTIPRWPRGLTDRLPPVYIYDPDGDGRADDCADKTSFLPSEGQAYYADYPDCGDGVPDGFETIPEGFTAEQLGRTPLCEHPDEIPWWKPVKKTNADGETVQAEGYGEPLPGVGDFSENGDMGQQKGPLFEVTCRRGGRASFGPWQVGTEEDEFDKLAYGAVRFENSDRLDRDIRHHGLDPSRGGDGRREWNDGTEFYNHFASHHGTCWSPGATTTGSAGKCNDPEDPWTASDTEEGGECHEYQAAADEGNGCYAADGDPRCSDEAEEHIDGQAFRNATQVPGRLYVEIPDGRAVVGLEDQIWDCDHHVVHQLPPGSYGMTELADYRKQEGGVANPAEVPIFGTPSGEKFGGSVGEMVIQYFTKPFTDPDVEPVNVMFEVVTDALTTWYPPFTYNVHRTVWYPPFDAAIGLATIHSHHRMVHGTVDIYPSNPVRPNSPEPECGGMAGGETPEHFYENWEWEDARLCEYWKDPDGPVIVRKGQPVVTTCYVNNGITPEAIKHGLVGGSTLEALRQMDAPIPEDPSTVPADTWKDALVNSPVGQEYLYGTHPPINYRVVYKCGPEPGVSPVLPFVDNAPICDPNPKLDADGDYVDGPYPNEPQCGDEGGWCNPSTVIFANVGEDEMCIPVFMYWALDRVTNEDGSINEEALDNLQAHVTTGASEGDPNEILQGIDETGTPGAVMPSPSDRGTCLECPSQDDVAKP